MSNPDAWLVTGAASTYLYVTLFRENADAAAEHEGGTVVPLYLAPTLTDAEREAVQVAMHRCDGPEFRTLRGLLERTK